MHVRCDAPIVVDGGSCTRGEPAGSVEHDAAARVVDRHTAPSELERGDDLVVHCLTVLGYGSGKDTH
jgi:hypothetical protein